VHQARLPIHLQVFLGAAAIMSNGTVMGRAGNAGVAMMAHAHSKPVSASSIAMLLLQAICLCRANPHLVET
jgi:translation initiation factor 2B subunit (eIF-2B alpha/beta/delta family)